MQSSTLLARQSASRPVGAHPALKFARRALGLLPLVVAAIIVVTPVWWTVASSLRLPAESFSLPPQWVPLHPDWNNYLDVFQKIPYGTYVLNSVIVAVSVVGGQI